MLAVAAAASAATFSHTLRVVIDGRSIAAPSSSHGPRSLFPLSGELAYHEDTAWTTCSIPTHSVRRRHLHRLPTPTR